MQEFDNLQEQDRHRRRLQAIREGKYLSMESVSEDDDNVEVEVPEMRSLGWYDKEPPTVENSGRPAESRENSLESQHTVFRASLMPAPLKTRRQKAPGEAGITEQAHELQDSSLTPPARAYGGAATKVQEQFGVDEVIVDFTHLEPLPPRRRPPIPQQAQWRKSLNRVSLTLCEMPYPIQMLRAVHNREDGYEQTEELLGLRRMSFGPPVPTKNPDRSGSGNHTRRAKVDVQPFYEEEITTEEPLNGRTAWLHSLTGMLVVFNCWGLGNSFGLFQAYYSEIYLPHTSPSAVAWIGSTQLALVFGLGVPVGRMVDKGYFRAMFHGGTLIMIFGLFLSSVCTHLWSLWLVNGLVTGLGMGTCFCSGIVTLMTWFDERKVGAAMGLGAAGSCVGGIVYVLLAGHFLATKRFKSTMLILGGVATATMIPPNLVFRVRGQRQRSHKQKRGLSKPISKIEWGIFASTSYLLAAGGMFFAFLGVYFGFVYIISFASTVLHLSDTAATNLLIFMLAANLPGRFLPALISDRCIGPLNTIIPSVFLSSAVIWLWAASGEHRGSLIVIACFYGFVSAGIQVLYAPTVYSFCLEPVSGRSNIIDAEGVNQESTRLAMDRVGIKAGGIFTCIGLACLISLPIGGALINYRTSRGMTQPYLGAQIFAGVCLLVGGCLLLGS